MAHIELNAVTLDYAVYSVRAQSLRNAVMNMAVGGRLLKNQRDVTVVARPLQRYLQGVRGRTAWV
jgi:hypothetical protein